MIGIILEAVMVVFSLVGAALVAYKTTEIIGYKVWITSSTLGTAFGIYYHHWMFVMLQATYIIIDLYALKKRQNHVQSRIS